MAHEKVTKKGIEKALRNIETLDVTIREKKPHFLEINPDSDFTKVSLGLVVHYITLRLNVLGFAFFNNPSEVSRQEVIETVGDMIWMTDKLQESFKKDRLSRFTSKDMPGSYYVSCWYDRQLRDDFHGCYWEKDFNKYWNGISNGLSCSGVPDNEQNKKNEAEVNACRDLHRKVIEVRQNEIFRELFEKPRQSWERLRKAFEDMAPKRVQELRVEIAALRSAVQAEQKD